MRLFLGLVFCTACVTTQSEVRLNPDLVLPYRFELENQKHLEAPYVAEYQKGSKQLLYIAAQHFHAAPTKNGLEHPTNKTIAKVFELYRPQVVINEGMPHPGIKSPPELKKIIHDCDGENPKNCAESAVTIKYAIQYGAEYITGEPSESEIVNQLNKQGYTAEDVLGFYMVRQIPQLPAKGLNLKENPRGIIDGMLKWYRKRIDYSGTWGFDDFTKWYDSKHLKNYLDTDYNDTAPNCGKDATYIHKISCAVGRIRDRNIVKVIDEMFREYDRVLIVYGGSHLVIDEPALIDALGPGKYKKYF